MKFTIKLNVTPDCSICEHVRFSKRVECDTLYCYKTGKKELAIEPCNDFILYKKSLSDSGIGSSIKSCRIEKDA